MPDEMRGPLNLAIVVADHERATGGDRVLPGQRYREPSTRAVWTVGAIRHDGIERTALLTGRRGDVLHLPASMLASTCETLPDA